MAGRRGTQRLRTTLSKLDPLSPETSTEIERLMLRLCRTHSLPEPVVNGWIQLNGVGFEPDFFWPAAKLIVETDGGTHRTRRAFEADRRRDQLLAEAGYMTLRFTWRQVTTEPERVARTIATVLERAGSHTSLRGNSALDRRSRRRTIPA
jgi:very-short-patch-repair endonuclease